MTRIRFACALVLLLGALASGSAAAHGVRFGFAFGFPVYPPAWYYPPPAYYYPPPVIAAPAAPPVYIERSDQQAAPSPPAEPYWYYCPDSRTYYPYVKDCRSPWQRVPARPPAS
jgi:hypothetical protein